MPATKEYIVTRTWSSRRQKLTYHISVGPFATRARALSYMQRAIRELNYAPSELAVGMLRPPHSVEQYPDIEV